MRTSPARLAAAAALALLGALPACARRHEQAARTAWDKAVRAGRGPSEDRSGPGGDGDSASARDAASWRALRDLILEIDDELALGVPTVDLAGLAARLCGGEPQLSREDAGLVYYCDPDPPRIVQGAELAVEVDTTGVVGFAALDLDGDASDILLRRALDRLADACTHSWTPVQRAEDALQEFYTCPMASGTVIAVGRFPRDLAANAWQFSLALLGPG